MALGVFVVGVVVGVVLAAALGALAAWTFVRTGRPADAGSPGTAAAAAAAAENGAGGGGVGVTSAMQEWPPDVVKFLRTMLGEPTTSETSRWLNAVLTRFWLELRVSALYKERMTRKLVSKLRRKLDTAFVRDIDISDLSFGDFPPSVKRVHLVQSTDMNEELLVMVDFDLEYKGGMALTIEVELATVNVLIPVTVTITEIVGRHGTEFNVSFVTEPLFGLNVQSRLLRNQQEYSLFRDRLDAYLTKRLKALFLEMWTLPVWRFFDLPLISLPTYVHPSCKCDLGDGVFRPSAEALGKGFTKSVALFPVTATPTPTSAQDMADALVARLLHVAQDNSQDWQTLKSKSGVLLQKNRRRLFTKDDAPFFRGMWSIQGEAVSVVQALADPELLKVLDLDYEACYELLPTPLVSGVGLRQYCFKRQDYVVLHVAKQVPTTWVPVDMWVVVLRSVQPPLDIPSKVDATKSVRGTVLLYGFLVEVIGTHGRSCQVTSVSQMDPSLAKHNFSFEHLVALKTEVTRRVGSEAAKPATGSAAAANPGVGASGAESASTRIAQLQRGPSMGWPWRDRSATASAAGRAAPPASDAPYAGAGAAGAAPAGTLLAPAAAPAAVSAQDADALLAAGPAALTPLPKVSSTNFPAVAEDTVTYFLELARRANDPVYSKPWRPVKRQQQTGLVLERKPADAAIVADIVRGTVFVACGAERAFAALRGSRYRSVAHPDLLSCESLVAYDDSTVVRHYRFHGSLLPDRDWVTLDVARAIGPGEWIVVQRSVAAAELVARSDAVRLVVHVAGYYVHTNPLGSLATAVVAGPLPTVAAAAAPTSALAGLPLVDDADGLSSCYITHVMQVSSEGSTFALQWLRYSWGWNLTTVKYALERSVEGGDISHGLPHVATSKLSEVTVKAGGLVWIAVPHAAAEVARRAAKAGMVPPSGLPAWPAADHGHQGQLSWEFSTRGGELKFALVFANNEAPKPRPLSSSASSAPPSGEGHGHGHHQPQGPTILLTASGTEVVLPSQMASLTSRGAADEPAPWEGATHIWPVVPTAVFNSHICPVTGSVNAAPTESGTFYLVFDNRGARFSDAHVVYKAAVTYHNADAAVDADLDLPVDDSLGPANGGGGGDRVLPDGSGTRVEDRANGASATVADDAGVDSLVRLPKLPAPPSAGASPARAAALGTHAGGARGRQHRRGSTIAPPPPLPDSHITGDVHIGRLEVLRIPLYLFSAVEEVRLVWEFRSGKDEIDFSIVYDESWRPDRPPEADQPHVYKTLLEPGRVSTEAEAFAGEIRAPGRAGRYYFVWDNSFSRWRTKMIGFSVMIVPSAFAPPIRGGHHRGGGGGRADPSHAAPGISNAITADPQSSDGPAASTAVDRPQTSAKPRRTRPPGAVAFA